MSGTSPHVRSPTAPTFERRPAMIDRVAVSVPASAHVFYGAVGQNLRIIPVPGPVSGTQQRPQDQHDFPPLSSIRCSSVATADVDVHESVQLVGDFCLGEEVVRRGSGAVVVTSSGKQKSIKGPQSWSLFETKAETVADLLVRLDEGELVQVISGDASFDYPWSVARRVRVSIEDKPLMVSMNINRDPIALDPQHGLIITNCPHMFFAEVSVGVGKLAPAKFGLNTGEIWVNYLATYDIDLVTLAGASPMLCAGSPRKAVNIYFNAATRVLFGQCVHALGYRIGANRNRARHGRIEANRWVLVKHGHTSVAPLWLPGSYWGGPAGDGILLKQNGYWKIDWARWYQGADVQRGNVLVLPLIQAHPIKPTKWKPKESEEQKQLRHLRRSIEAAQQKNR